jgi:hypothetical protein
MRQFTAGDGSDSTAAVLSYLSTHAGLYLADLILIGELEDPAAVWLTSWNSPLSWPVWGNFQPAVISRGKMSSQIGLEVDTLQFTWSPPLTAFGSSTATANPYQKAQTGFYDNRKFRLWRTVMPDPGDANTLGACEVFGGRISSTTVRRGQIEFTVNSFLDVIDQPVPPNVIELNNTLANYAGSTPVVADSETLLPQFTVVAPTSTNKVFAACTSPTLNKIYGSNKFAHGFMVFNPGSSLEGYWSPISSNGDTLIVSTHYNGFTLYAPFPWAPQVGDTFYCSIKPPINLQDAEAGFAYFGFPYVPQPEGAA